MDHGPSYTVGNDKTFQPKNVAQIISGNVFALDRSKQTQNCEPNINKFREIIQPEPADSQTEPLKKRPSSYNEFGRSSAALG